MEFSAELQSTVTTRLPVSVVVNTPTCASSGERVTVSWAIVPWSIVVG